MVIYVRIQGVASLALKAGLHLTKGGPAKTIRILNNANYGKSVIVGVNWSSFYMGAI